MKSRRLLKGLLFFLAGGALSLVVLALVANISNQSLPTGPASSDRLTPIDKARLAEALHLKTALGDTIWPGWGTMELPVLIWHRDNSFLVGIENPPPGWQPVPNDQFQGEPYFANPGFDPENFAMNIGGQWVASMATKGETDRFMREMFQEVIPDPLEDFFPYRILILNSEIQISGVLHESFHVYQAVLSLDKFTSADQAARQGDRYWDLDPAMSGGWEAEINLLVEGAAAQNRQDARAAAQQFLAVRDSRRVEHGLPAALVAYEVETEWLEGLAKYVELSIWEAANKASSYQPLPDTTSDPDFKDYQTFQNRWKQEISQAKRQARIQGDVRFYYTGMLQAKVLDKLLPDWKTASMGEGVYLEDLIRSALAP